MTRRPNWIVAVAAMTAGCHCWFECLPYNPDDERDTDTAVGEPLCANGIKGPPIPADGAVDVYVHGTFLVDFLIDETADTAFTLRDAGGAIVPLGEIQHDVSGRTFWFTAVEPLAPLATYTLTIAFGCDRSGTVRFTTSSTGVEVSPDAFLGQAYALDQGTAVFVQPSGVNALLGSLLGQLEQSIVFVPQAFDPDTQALTFYGGLVSPDGAQDLCGTTFDLPSTSFLDDPAFELDAPDGLTLSLGGADVSLLDLTLTGAFNPDATRIEGVGVSTTIDTRALAPALGDLLGGATGDSAFCDLIGQFTAGAVYCEPCPATDPLGEGEYCLTILVKNAIANRVAWPLVRVTPEDVTANPECAAPAP